MTRKGGKVKKWRIPGTVLQIEKEKADGVEAMFSSMFLAGGMVLSQVASITGLEPYTIQNWVKRGFLSPPQRKRYSMGQLCRILHINMLKSVLPLEQICSLLSFVNGTLGDESDDMIDDSQLYFMFVQLAARMKELYEPEAANAMLDQFLQDYTEPVPGARERVRKVLRVMLTAWLAARMTQNAHRMLDELQ